MESAVSILPSELRIRRTLGLHPLRRAGFDFLDQLADRDCSPQRARDVNVVVACADRMARATNAPARPCDILEQFGFNALVNPRMTALGAEDEMQQHV
jgi:hypothetical protein